jgi:hypothetical protein
MRLFTTSVIRVRELRGPRRVPQESLERRGPSEKPQRGEEATEVLKGLRMRFGKSEEREMRWR